MKKKFVCLLMTVMLLVMTACSSPSPDGVLDLQEEILQVLANAQYENLEILFDEISYYEGQALEVCTIGWYPNEGYPQSRETMELYAEVVFPELMDVERLDTNYITEHEGASYESVLENIDTYEEIPLLIYENEADCSFIYGPTNWRSGAYISQGVIGKYADSTSAFAAKNIVVDEKIYDCRLDDLSDSYILMDGEKTVAEAKAELEAYFDEHYPFADRENGIKHDIWQIAVGKIEGIDHYVYHAYRTFVYNGIPFTEARTNNVGRYLEIMGESYMCESNKVDVTIGLVNGYTQPQLVRTIDKLLSFQEVLDAVAQYLTGETRFQLLYGGLEYRLLMDDAVYQMIPTWVFIAKNPNDDKLLKLYVDMETGEMTSFQYEF